MYLTIVGSINRGKYNTPLHVNKLCHWLHPSKAKTRAFFALSLSVYVDSSTVVSHVTAVLVICHWINIIHSFSETLQRLFWNSLQRANFDIDGFKYRTIFFSIVPRGEAWHAVSLEKSWYLMGSGGVQLIREWLQPINIKIYSIWYEVKTLKTCQNSYQSVTIIMHAFSRNIVNYYNRVTDISIHEGFSNP